MKAITKKEAKQAWLDTRAKWESVYQELEVVKNQICEPCGWCRATGKHSINQGQCSICELPKTNICNVQSSQHSKTFYKKALKGIHQAINETLLIITACDAALAAYGAKPWRGRRK